MNSRMLVEREVRAHIRISEQIIDDGLSGGLWLYWLWTRLVDGAIDRGELSAVVKWGETYGRWYRA